MPLPSFLGPFTDVPTGTAAADTAVSAAGLGAASKRLVFSMAQPKPTEWCWAATAAAVASFYASVHQVGQPLTPCQVATQCLFTECCPEPTDPTNSRNREYALEGALSTLNHLAGTPCKDLSIFNPWSMRSEVTGRFAATSHGTRQIRTTVISTPSSATTSPMKMSTSATVSTVIRRCPTRSSRKPIKGMAPGT